MSLYVALLLVSVGLAGWIWGALKPHRRLWILVLIWPSAAWLLWMLGLYLWTARPTIDNHAEIGWPTLICIVLGVGAIISSPRQADRNDGATNA